MYELGSYQPTREAQTATTSSRLDDDDVMIIFLMCFIHFNVCFESSLCNFPAELFPSILQHTFYTYILTIYYYSNTVDIHMLKPICRHLWSEGVFIWQLSSITLNCVCETVESHWTIYHVQGAKWTRRKLTLLSRPKHYQPT